MRPLSRLIRGAMLRLINPLDTLVRLPQGLAYLPDYATRVRSNGTIRQFGGQRFVREGRYLVQLLREHAGVDASSEVMEIGCGCGRMALPLADVLESSHYLGMDIDGKALRACMKDPRLQASNFRFQLVDVFNGVYNPTGTQPAETYRFPLEDRSFDVIFLMSVFTHMLPDAVAHYVAEIARLLKPGGRCMFSAFLMDYGHEGVALAFNSELGQCRVVDSSVPEKAVGYTLTTLDRYFAEAGMSRREDPLLGQWRGSMAVPPAASVFPQDILVYAK